MKKVLVLLVLSVISLSILAATPIRYKINGVDGEILKNIQTRLANQQANLKAPISSSQANEFIRQSPSEIKQAMMPFGYFKPNIKSQLVRNKKGWYAQFFIQTGPPLKLRHVTLNIQGPGANQPIFQRYKKHFHIKPGQRLNVPKYEKAKQRLFNQAITHGFIDAKITHSNIIINRKNNSADINITFDTGKRYRFGDISFSKTPFSQAFLMRFIQFKAGDYYNSNQIQSLQDAYVNSGYFTRVNVTPVFDKAKQGDVPIHINLVTRKATQYNFGLGYGTDTGIRGLIGVNFRHLTKTGHHLKATLRASQIQSSLQASYIIPGRNPSTDQYNITAGISHQDQTNGKSLKQQLGAGYQTSVYGWKQVLGVSLQRETSTLENNPSQTTLMLIPSANWSRIKSDDPIKPTRGYKIGLTLRGASSALVSSTSFFQALLNAKYIHTFKKTHTRLVLRGDLGYTAINKIEDLPFSLQYFAGGAQSVRGYGYDSLGPGRSLVVGSAELQQRVYGNWYATAFLDAGNVSDQLIPKLKKGAGIGVMWQSPVGAIELTAAKALDLPGHPIRIQFSMGPDL